MPEPNLDPALSRLAAGLRDLIPAGVINRDRILFEAGRRSAPSRAWPLATGAFAALAAILGVRLTTLPTAVPEVVVVHVPAPRAEPSVPETPPADRHPARSNIIIDWLFAASPMIAKPDELRVRDMTLSTGSVQAGAAAGPSPPVERWLGLPAILFSDSLKLQPNFGPYRGEV